MSVFISLKLREEKPATVPVKTKAAGITYRKFIALNLTSPTPPAPTEETPSPTPTLVTSPKKESEEPSPTNQVTTPTATPINLATTPLITEEPTGAELADSSQNSQEATKESETTLSPTKESVKTLPQTGIYQVSLIIFTTALTLIVVSFILG